MSKSILDTMPKNAEQMTTLQYFENSSFDELIEIDLAHGSCRNIYHIEGKFFVPILKGTLSDLIPYCADHMVHPDEREDYINFIEPDTLKERLTSFENSCLISKQLRFRLLDGGWRWTECVILGGPAHALPEDILRMYIFDIQYQRDRANNQISSYPASGNRDELTSLLREKSFFTLARTMVTGHLIKWCVVAMDIENFKLFNDWYGRGAGDLLLAQIGAVLKHEENHHGALACYRGQDDFCLLMQFNTERIEILFERVHQLVKAHGSSMGFLPAFGYSVLDQGMAILDALDQALLAVSHIKGNFHNRIQAYDPSMRNKTEDEYRILSDFQHALTHHELYFCLQPQCQVPSGRIVGAESLSRWKKADGQMIRPDSFIPVLEKYGFVTDLDQYIWTEVCAWLSRWIKSGHTPVPISVNVSQIDILSIDVPQFMNELIQKYELPKELLKIEITESAYVSDSSQVKRAVQQLRDDGFLVLMDDFGSGYSSLNMLGKLNVDVIKLDAQFLRMNDADDRKGIRILETIVNMTKTMALPIIVEGVETDEQVNFLESLGCRYIQGYRFYRPMNVDEFEKLIENEENIDTHGFSFKSNQQFLMREFMDQNIYSDAMLNNILGPAALYCWDGKENVNIERYNEQFFRIVNVPDFVHRIKGIQRYFHPNDVPVLFNMLRTAEKDRLNGSSGVCGVYRTDGSIGRFHLKFYYLEERDNGKIFYGAMSEITEITSLQNQMRLLSKYSSATVVFVKNIENKWSYKVSVHGLRDVMGITKEELEEELQSKKFYSRVDESIQEQLKKKTMDSISRNSGFGFTFTMTNARDEQIELYMKADIVDDEYSDVRYILNLRQLEA
ncbi:MAG: GGDEF domain-containing phosphodiesterase [Lachnospiraceae bacterium]|nr:GGDEF domain-containing phosphodiesterase [Lachnospiraceae bacterium]